MSTPPVLRASDAVLDDPVGSSLTGAHAHLARVRGRAACYPAEVSPFAALAEPTAAALVDLEGLVAPGEVVALLGGGPPPGDAWQPLDRLEVRQMVCHAAVDAPAAALAPTPLGAADVAEMLALAQATEPGPFLPRTIELGRYVGVRVDGQLVAMGGERMHPPGFTEVSAICTDPAFRGRRLAESVVRALTARIQARGEVPFLHVVAGSPAERAAAALYERLGFRERRRAHVSLLLRR